MTPLRLDGGTHSYSPVCAPRGDEVYFVASPRSGVVGGSIKAVHSDGSGERLVRAGAYNSVIVSPNGVHLAVVAALGRYEGGPLLLLDTIGNVLDTLSAPGQRVVAARFVESSDDMYFYLYDFGFVHFDATSHTQDTVLRTRLRISHDFDVSGDSLLALPGGLYHLRNGVVDSLPDFRQPRFNPMIPSLVLGVQGRGDFRSDLVLFDRSDGSIQHLDARPYYSCDLLDPAWSPNGDRVVLSAAELRWGQGDLRAWRYDLWTVTLGEAGATP